MCIFDDADTTNTTKLVQHHILEQVRGQIIMLASYQFKVYGVNNCSFIKFSLPMNTKQFFLNVNDYADKFEVLTAIYKVLVSTKTKAIVFCNVSNTYN